MKRILLAWELGDGLGHVTRLLPIARELRAIGHACIFAVRNLGPASKLVQDVGFDVLQAPFTVPAKPRTSMLSYADILATVGYGEAERLAALACGWATLLRTLRIDLLVADFAPTACLAANGIVPFMSIGDAFTLPAVRDDQFVPFRSGEAIPGSDRALLNVVREVQAGAGRTVPHSLPQILADGWQLIVTLPELYGDLPPTERLAMIGPMGTLPPPAATTPAHDYFAYLSAKAPGVSTALEFLATSPLRGTVYLRDASTAQRRRLAGMGLKLHDQPQDMASTVGNARVLVHHGGLGTAEMGLALGRPQLIVPRHQEQVLNGTRLRHLGVAVSMLSGGRYEAGHFAAALAHAGSGKLFDDASRMAARIAARGSQAGADQAVKIIASLL